MWKKNECASLIRKKIKNLKLKIKKFLKNKKK